MHQVSTITLSAEVNAQVLEVRDGYLGAAELASIGLPSQRPILVIIGGASQLSDEIFQQIQGFFVAVLAPIAENNQAIVVDGGTDTGVMRLMGKARSQIGGTFPLVGVAPRGLVLLAGESAQSDQQALLEPNHTHFVLVPGDAWGDESMALSQVATKLAAGAPTIAIMLNGGAVTWHDAANNVGEGRSLLVIDGTGRAADELADVVRGAVGSQQAEAIVETGLVHVVDLMTKHERVIQQIETFLKPGTF